MAHSNPKLVCRNVWKIFGARAREFLDGAGADTGLDALRRHGLVGAVRDVNLEVREGEIFVIMGLSGSGKSTLIRHINRLIDPTAGQVLVGGADVVGMNDKELREFRRNQTAMVFQTGALKNPEVTAAEIRQDLITYARTRTLAQLEGPSALQHIREDLNERVATRTNGAVSELVIETLVVQ